MDLSADECANQILSAGGNKPSDEIRPEDKEFKLPEWFDEEIYNKGRRFFWSNSFSLATSMVLGLVAVFSVPSILSVLIGSRRSSSVFTAYKRYISTHMHTMSWMRNELKPGSESWRSLQAVRSRHFKAGVASKARGGGVVTQRDLALTQFGFIGFAMLKPDAFGIRQLEPGDWEAYNHLWGVIGHMIGIEDRYNVCRRTFVETREVCRIMKERVYTPCLENVPEYFEHMSRVMINGLWCLNPSLEVDSTLFLCRYLADVPGYVYTEEERLKFQDTLRQHLKGKPEDTGVDASELVPKYELGGLPPRKRNLFYLRDYDDIEQVPVYKRMNPKAKRLIAFGTIYVTLYTTYWGRIYYNMLYMWTINIGYRFPYLAIYAFGFKKAFVNMFKEDPIDDTVPKTNEDYYNEKPKPSWPWYLAWLDLIW